MKLVEIKNISKIYHTNRNEIKALDNISFDINKGDFIAIVGPSGCGKSTILSILCGLENKSSGQIIKNSDLKFGFMFQQDTLFDWLTIKDNCLIGAKINNCLNEKTINRCEELLKTYGLIRTLVLNPDILLLDEPFSALDYQNRLVISNDVYNALKKENKTAIMVTHDVAEAVSMADIVIVLSNRPAKIINTYNITYEKKDTPIKNRLKEEFNSYCNLIWRDLNVI